mgnify:CR=1 FL=1
METIDFSKPVEYEAAGPNGVEIFREDSLRLDIYSFDGKTGRHFWYATPADRPEYVVNMSTLRNVD